MAELASSRQLIDDASCDSVHRVDVATTRASQWFKCMVRYVMVNADLYSAIITKVSNALDTLVSGEKPGFQALSEGLVVLLCAKVVREAGQEYQTMGPCTANARRPAAVYCMPCDAGERHSAPLTAPILSVSPALIVHSELKSVHPGFPVAFIF